MAAFVELDETNRTGSVGLFNVLRELGAPVGTAAAAHLLTSRASQHGLELLDALEPRNVATLARTSIEQGAAVLEKLVAIVTSRAFWHSGPRRRALRRKPRAGSPDSPSMPLERPGVRDVGKSGGTLAALAGERRHDYESRP